MVRQTRLRNPNLQIGGRRRIRLPSGKWWSLIYFASAVFIFAAVYASLPWLGLGGVTHTVTGADVKAAPDFWDCCYFSVITITTIGYGDYRPTGYARIGNRGLRDYRWHTGRRGPKTHLNRLVSQTHLRQPKQFYRP